MTKPDWCPQWAWDIVDAELAGPGVHVHRISYEIVSERIARTLLAAERQGMERAAGIATERLCPDTAKAIRAAAKEIEP